MKKAINKAPQESRQRFHAWRFGMFIHYGLFSQHSRGAWAICYERIPLDEYKQLTAAFTPAKLNINEWVSLAVKTKMRYMCLTTRHHEGFALFDTRVSGFNSVKMFGRDIVREYVEACRAAGLGVGLYYSVADWFDAGCIDGPKKNPAAWKKFIEAAHAQLRELMSNYGRIDYLFYDGCPPPATWDIAGINAEIRQLQPGILISDRCGLDEDVKSAEGHTISNPGKAWETCLTINDSWGYNSKDLFWKTPRALIRTLLTTAHNNGNLLLNIGPRMDGSLQPGAIEALEKMGAWLERNGAAIFGTQGNPFNYADQKLSTYKGNVAYVPLNFYFGSKTIVAGIANQVKNVELLNTKASVKFRQEGCRIFLEGLPEEDPDAFTTVVRMELDGAPLAEPHPLLAQVNKYD